MQQQEFVELTKSIETVSLEFNLARSAIPASFGETYSSFANTDGRTILLGVRHLGIVVRSLSDGRTYMRSALPSDGRKESENE